MPSTYTVNLGIEKPATGEQSGTWGDTTNLNFDILDQAINGAISITLASAGTSGSPNTLAISDGATSDGRNKWIEFTDGVDLGATAFVQLTPNDAEKIVFIRNSLSGSRSVILFQGTYDAGRDLEVPAGVDMVVKFSGGGATATTTDLFTKLRATEITTPTLTTDDLTAGTADINDGTVEAVIGGTTPKAGTFTTITANTNLTINATTTVDGVIDDDTMATASATKLATSESIKAYVDSSVGAQDTLSEILANGNTSGSNNLIIDNGQALTANTINETTAGSGVTIDSVLLKDDGVNATQIEVTNIKANDGTAAGSIANSTGAVTITSFVSNSVDIGGGAIDDTVIGATTPAAISGTTGTFSGNLTVDTNTLFVNATNNRVGIGTSSPSELLDVNGDALINGLTVGRGVGDISTNTAVGVGTLSSNTTGAANAATGFQALYSNTTAYSNTAAGYQSLYSNTTGVQNTATGRDALSANTTGANNTATGFQALYSNTTAYSNTAAGYQSLYSNTTGNQNSAAGYQSLYSNTNGSSNSATGQQALYSNTTAYSNTATGYRALYSNTTGVQNTASGTNAGDVITTGSRNTIVGVSCDPSAAGGIDQIVVGYAITGKGDDTAFVGGTNGAYNQKNVTTWETTSDERLKKNITDNKTGLDVLSKIQVRNFEYRTPDEITGLPSHAAIEKDGVQLGVIAQEIQEVLPECVSENSTGVLSVNTDPLVWYLINAVKELKAEIQELKGN